MTLTLWIILASILLIGIVIYLVFKRNYFNKYKYIRLVTYNEDMTESIRYYKKEEFDYDSIKINPKHIYNCKGYVSIITTSKAAESINPIDFESKYDAKLFKIAIKSKHISEAFKSMQPKKIDLIMVLVFISVIQLLAIAYLLYSLMGGGTVA